MVNTFMTSASLQECARNLHWKHLGKQRVEAYQLWRTLKGKGRLLPDGTDGPPTKGWIHHPATLAWQGHTCALAMYTNVMIQEWIDRGYKNTMKFLPHCKNPRFPWWWGWEPMIMSHKASLHLKFPEFYTWDVGKYSDHGYIWPSKVPEEYKGVNDPPLEKVCAAVTSKRLVISKKYSTQSV